MVFQPTIIVNQTGSSGIPAYDSLEEITSPTAGMVVKINGEGGSGTPRGVEVGDVLGVVTWADTADKLFAGMYYTQEVTLLIFTDGTSLRLSLDVDTDMSRVLTGIIYFNDGIQQWYTGTLLTPDAGDFDYYDNPKPPFNWLSTTYDFGGRTVSATGTLIQSVILVTPDKYYIYKDSAWVELVDLADVITTSTTDLEDGVSSLATGTYYFVMEE